MPLIGFLVGLLAWGLYLLLINRIPNEALIFILLLFLTYITGGLHEDALADSFDAFGSCSNRKKTLEIMKDSRIGAFGSLALIFQILGKFMFLKYIPITILPQAIIVSLVLGRWTALPMLKFMHHPRKNDKKVFFETDKKKIPMFFLLISTIFSLGVVVYFFPQLALYLILSCIFLLILMMMYFYKRIGGATGDCCGATEQIAELLVYFIIMVAL